MSKSDTVREYHPNGAVRVEVQQLSGYLVRRSWFENGRMKGELFAVNGVPCGRVRSWDENGDLIAEQYFIHGRKASKKKYLECGKSDPTLPAIEEDDQVAWASSGDHHVTTPPTASLADYPDKRVALEWLQAPLAKGIRTLGELSTIEQSIELVREFISCGAKEVWVPEVTVDEDGNETASQLLVALPKTKSKRKAVLALCNEFNQSAGFDPISDEGQELVDVALD